MKPALTSVNRLGDSLSITYSTGEPLRWTMPYDDRRRGRARGAVKTKQDCPALSVAQFTSLIEQVKQHPTR